MIKINTNSSIIKSIEYDAENELITFFFVDTYFIDQETYKDFSYEYFEKLLDQKSIGKFYLHFIKSNFKKQNMANSKKQAPAASTPAPAAKKKPNTKNESSTSKRFIDLSIDVTLIDKDWLYVGEKGTYLKMTLIMMPDGTVDSHGNLGMIVQKVPKEVWEKDKKARGEILGNGAELDWAGYNSNSENSPTEVTGTLGSKTDTKDWADDLPF